VKNTFGSIHRRDAENAKVAQRISNWGTTKNRWVRVTDLGSEFSFQLEDAQGRNSENNVFGSPGVYAWEQKSG